jgi:hypothetical protein
MALNRLAGFGFGLAVPIFHGKEEIFVSRATAIHT